MTRQGKVAIAGGVLALLCAAPAAAAPGGDATIMATGSLSLSAGGQASAVVMCPAGTRALGGGAQPLNVVSPPNNNYYRVGFSGPVDDSGTSSGTATGDIPRGWFVVVSNAVAPGTTTFRTYAICSATSDATIQSSATANVPMTTERTVACPAGTRAVGGGVTTPSTIPATTASVNPYLNRSAPVNSGGTVAGTQTGDVATGWLVNGSPQSGGGSLDYNFLAICSAGSDATVQVATFNVVNPPSDASNTATAVCPAGQRALSGGIGVDAVGGLNYRVQVSGPLDAGGTPEGTDLGDVVQSWLGAARTNNPGAGSTTTAWRTIALCATDDVPPTGGGGDGGGDGGGGGGGGGDTGDTTPPDTIKGKGPARRITKTRATFNFSSDDATAHFECALDRKPAAACTSPTTVKHLKKGRHEFTVAAIDAAGNRDPSPAVFSFKVKKKRKHHR